MGSGAEGFYLRVAGGAAEVQDEPEGRWAAGEGRAWVPNSKEHPLQSPLENLGKGEEG